MLKGEINKIKNNQFAENSCKWSLCVKAYDDVNSDSFVSLLLVNMEK